MSSPVVETIYGRKHKYEIKAVDLFLSRVFVIYRDGQRWKGSYDSLSRAVEVARDAS